MNPENPCVACTDRSEILCDYIRGTFAQVVGMHEPAQQGETLERCATELKDRAGCQKSYEEIYTELGRIITESRA